MAAPNWYNQGDQAIFQDNQFIPQEQYRLGPYPNIHEGEEAPQDSGIPYTNAFTNAGGGVGGGGNLNNIRTSKNYKRPDGTYLGQGSIGLPGNISQSGPGRHFIYDETGEEYDDIGLYGGVTKETLGQKIKSNPIIEGLMGLAIPGFNFLKGGAQWLGNKLPINERAIMENEMLGQGWALDDIGRVARGGGAYDTAGNVMSGYNAAKLDEESFDKRIAMATKYMSEANKYKRIAALKAAKKQWQDAQTNTAAIKLRKEKEREIKAYKGPPTVGYDESGPTQQDIRDTRPDKSGKSGHTNPGKDSYGPHLKDGGRIGFKEGGSDYGQFERRQAHNIAAGPEAMNVGGDGPELTKTTKRNLSISPFVNMEENKLNLHVPVDVGLKANTKRARLLANLNLRNLNKALTHGKEDSTVVNSWDDVKNLIEPSLDLSANVNNLNLGYTTNFDNENTANISYAPNDNLTIGATTDFDNSNQLGFSYNNPDNPWSFGATLDNQGNKYIGGKLKYTFNNGGLVGIL